MESGVNKMNGDELIPVIDENGKTTSHSTQRDVFSLALRHKSIRILVMRSSGDYLFQKRSPDKFIYPNCWDTSVADVVRANESYEQAAISALYNQLGIESIGDDLATLDVIKFITPQLKTHCMCYVIYYDGVLCVNSKEISGLRWEGVVNFDKYEQFLKHENIHSICRRFLDTFSYL